MSHDPLDQELAALGIPPEAAPVASAGDILARAGALAPVITGLAGWKLGGALAAAGLLGSLGGAGGVLYAMQPAQTHSTILLTETVVERVEVPATQESLPAELVAAPPAQVVTRWRTPSCEGPSQSLAAHSDRGSAVPPDQVATVADGPPVEDSAHEPLDADFLDQLFVREPTPDPQPVAVVATQEGAELERARSGQALLRLSMGASGDLVRPALAPIGGVGVLTADWKFSPTPVGTPWAGGGAELLLASGQENRRVTPGLRAEGGLSWGERFGLDLGWTLSSRLILAGPETRSQLSWGTGPELALRAGKLRVATSFQKGLGMVDDRPAPSLAALTVGLSTPLSGLLD